MTIRTYEQRVTDAFQWMQDNRKGYHLKTASNPNAFDFGDWLQAMRDKFGKTSQEMADFFTLKTHDETLLDRVEAFLEVDSERGHNGKLNRTGPFHSQTTLDLVGMFGIENLELCHRCQKNPIVRGEMCESCAQESDAEIDARMRNWGGKREGAGRKPQETMESIAVDALQEAHDEGLDASDCYWMAVGVVSRFLREKGHSSKQEAIATAKSIVERFQPALKRK
jgi:hypothetical protein